jgi:hypothetical protein
MIAWLRSEKASALFLYSAWVVVCAGLFMLFMLTPWFPEIEAMPKGELPLRILGGVLGVLGAPAALVIWTGMIVYCARIDTSAVGLKTFWFILFCTTAWFGAAVYFFTVYRRDVHAAKLLASA